MPSFSPTTLLLFASPRFPMKMLKLVEEGEKVNLSQIKSTPPSTSRRWGS